MLWEIGIRATRGAAGKKLQNAGVRLRPVQDEKHVKRWRSMEWGTACKVGGGERNRGAGRKGPSGKSSCPAGRQLQLDSNSTTPFPQPKCLPRADFNPIALESPIQDPGQTYSNSRRRVQVPTYKKNDGDFQVFRYLYAAINQSSKAKNGVHDHRHKPMMVNTVSQYGKETNMQSMTQWFLFVLGTIPNKHPSTRPHFLLPHSRVPGKEPPDGNASPGSLSS